MDVEFARTFLEIVRTRSFVVAAGRLHVTQTAVSARVQTLEQQLGQQLFVRERGNIHLTPSGERFLPYATNLVRSWDDARSALAIPVGEPNQVSVGCEHSLSEPLMLNWLIWMHEQQPDIHVQADVDHADNLVERVARGSLDIAVVYSPVYTPGLQIELLMEEKLILVTTDESGGYDPSRYIRTGWGSEFQDKHDDAFPELRHQTTYIGLGPLARQYILKVGGSGYFRSRIVRPHLDRKELFRVPDAPEVTYPVYTVTRNDNERVRAAMNGLIQVASSAQ